MTWEELLACAYMQGYPGDDAIDGIPAEPLEALKQAPLTEEALLNPAIGDAELYYAFLKDTAQKRNIPAVDMANPGVLASLNSQVAQALWKNQVDYVRIIRCMVCAPSYNGFQKEQRWMLSAGLVTKSVNPVLNEPWIAAAKPVIRLSPIASPAEIYPSYLKAVWTRKPDMALQEAERECVRAMKRSGFSSGIIRSAMEECSLQFPRPERPDIDLSKPMGDVERRAMEDYEREWKERGKKMDDFLQEALSGQTEQQAEKPQEPARKDDGEIYHDMQEVLRSLKPFHDTGDLLEYWGKAIKTMQEALLQVEQAKTTCKILALWGIGLEKAAREMGQDMNPEVRRMQEKLQLVMQKAEDQDKDWEFLYSLMAKVDIFSRNLLRTATERREKSPLLSRPEIQHAPPLADVLSQKGYGKGYHETLYLAAVREAAWKQDGLEEREADLGAVKRLLSHGVSQADIGKALACSPQLRDLPVSDRLQETYRLLRAAREARMPEQGRGGERT